MTAYACGLATLLVLGSICEGDYTSALFREGCDPGGRYQIGVTQPDGQVLPAYEILATAPHCIPRILRGAGEALRSRCVYEGEPTEWVPPVYGPVDDCGPASGG